MDPSSSIGSGASFRSAGIFLCYESIETVSCCSRKKNTLRPSFEPQLASVSVSDERILPAPNGKEHGEKHAFNFLTLEGITQNVVNRFG